MIPTEWIKASLVLPGLGATSVETLVRPVAAVMGPAAAAESRRVETAFLDAMRGEGFSIGEGVAIPHIEMAHLTETVVCLATLRRPLPLKTVDGRPADIFLFVLSKPDHQEHLLLLAHLARLAQSRTLLDGLRRAQTAEEAVALVRAAEMRHRALQGPAMAPPSTSQTLFLLSVGGEKAVDALLIDLVDQGFGEACILEAQTLREAATREVPLFAGFRDLFGDPGGRRILLLEAPVDRTDAIIETVRRISQEHRANDARVSVVPIQTSWIMPPVDDEGASEGH